MKLIKLFSVYCLLVTTLVSAQKKDITLEDIWSKGTFRSERLDALHSMKNGKQYSVLNYDRKTGSTTVDIFDYSTLDKKKTLVSSKDLEAIKYFTDYSFSADESKILLATEVKSIFRRSSVGVYFVYDVNTKTLTKVSDNKIQEPTFSPDGTKIAFGFENNLYVKDLNTDATAQFTVDGEKNKVINGITDWVYEEEFGFVRAFDWNANGTKIAFIRFDETNVPEFSMDVYGSKLYQTQTVFKYPKAGEANSKVSLHVFDLKAKTLSEVKVNKAYNDFYIPRINWTNDADVLSAQFANRHQNELDLWMINTATNTSKIAVAEKDKAYVDVTDNLTFLKDHSFIWTSERDGYNHIYHYDFNGNLINQVTSGNWEVTNYYGFNPSKKTIYYQSVENGSTNRGLYSIGLDGSNKKLLSNESGQNTAAFSTNLNYFINTFSSSEIPPIYSLYSAEGEMLKVIKDNAELKEELSDYKMSPKEFSTININGNDLNMWMIKPADFDENKKYPMLMFQYSGPGSQQVANKWNAANDYWHNMLAQKGMIIACVDGRGTGFKGADFKKSTYLNLVKYETEDQIAAAKKLAERSYIDEDNIGIWGWSFGGHMSTNSLLKGSDIFTTAIAVAPVTSWRFYDTVYTERFLRTPQENKAGYDDNSPVNYADKLEGNYLLVHGTGDDNVHVQNSYRMINALIEANKQFDMFIVPDRTHGIYKGKNTRLNLYTKMTNFVEEHLIEKSNKTTEIKG